MLLATLARKARGLSPHISVWVRDELQARNSWRNSWRNSLTPHAPSPRRYAGQWVDGERHGEGVFMYANGSRYVGQWEHNKKVGHGTFTFEDGSVREDLERMGIPVAVLGVRQHGIERPLRFLAEHRDIRRRLAELVQRHPQVVERWRV